MVAIGANVAREYASLSLPLSFPRPIGPPSASRSRRAPLGAFPPSLNKRAQGRAADTPLHEADVGAVEAAVKRELLLGDARPGAELPQGLPECLFRAGIRVDLFSGSLRILLRFGPLRQQSNPDILRWIFPRNMFPI
jgi:hypothetical protein